MTNVDPYAALKQYKQWVLYNKTNKVPLDPSTLIPGALDDPKNQLTYDEAIRYQSDSIGVGFYFTKNDPFFFLDIDTEKELYTGKTFGGWTEETKSILSLFPGALVESSMSGLGLHVIGSGNCPEHRCRNEHKEFYNHSRYVAITFNNASGDAGLNQDAGLSTLVQQYFQPMVASGTGEGWTTEPRGDWAGPTDDDELIEVFKAINASANQLFGGGATNRQLWENDQDALALAFPPDDPSIKTYNGSSADMSLALRLLWVTGCDCERTEHLMWESGMIRDKWEARPGYVTETVQKAYKMHGDAPVYNSPKYRSTSPVIGSSRPRGQFIMGTEAMQAYFKGMVYVSSLGKVFTADEEVPLAGQQVFNDLFSNACQFQMTVENEKPTRKAWDAFCNSAVFETPRVRGICFSPKHAYGDIVQLGTDSNGAAIRDVNICSLPQVETMPGDPTPFLDLVARMLANPKDQQILLSYFAACVQYPGVKFKWAPVIQGEEGNGKSFLLKFLKYAMGNKYIHTLASHELTNGFNAWLGRSTLVLAEDLHIDPRNRRATMEILKQMITSPEQSITNKGVDAESKHIHANFIFTTNHKDTIQKSEGARRYCMLFTQQQEYDDIARTGLTTDYFNALSAWVDDEDEGGSGSNTGLKIVAHYLKTYPIPEHLDPTKGAKRAPDTSSTADAIVHGRSFDEQIIAEAVDMQEIGFRGGWVSTKAVSFKFKENGITKSPTGMRQALKRLGYFPHPALEGSAIYTGHVMDGQNTRLYIHKGSDLINLKREQIKEAYMSAQSLDNAGS